MAYLPPIADPVMAGIFRCRNAQCGEEWVVHDTPHLEPWPADSWWHRCPACGGATERVGAIEVRRTTHYFLLRAGKLRKWYGRTDG